jgi:hypothetical protein
MLDSGTVLDFNGIRKGTYVDVLFLGKLRLKFRVEYLGNVPMI